LHSQLRPCSMVLCQVRPGAATTFNRLRTDYGSTSPFRQNDSLLLHRAEKRHQELMHHMDQRIDDLGFL
jgi:hypothetical protein